MSMERKCWEVLRGAERCSPLRKKKWDPCRFNCNLWSIMSSALSSHLVILGHASFHWGSWAVKPQNWLTEAGAHLRLERACLAAVCWRLLTVSASSVRALWVKVSDLGWTNNPNTTPTKDYEMSKWWCASAVPEGIHLWGGGCFYTKGMMQMWIEGTPDN